MPEKLVRAIGRRDLYAIMINAIIGAGIFGLPSKVFALIGAYSVLAYMVCASIVGLIVLCYAEVASRFATTGGPYLYARTAFGTLVGFEMGWLYWIVRIATFAANCNLLVTYLDFYLPGVTRGAPRIVAIVAVTSIIVGVNVVGVRQSALAARLLTIGKLVPLGIFACVGLFFVDPGNFGGGEVPALPAFSRSVLLLIYAFVGFEVAVVLGGEIKDPPRDIPLSLLLSLATVAILYMMVQVVCIGTLPTLASSERPVADASLQFLGRYGAMLVTAGAILSILGNLHVGILGGTRLLFAMSEQGDLPASLGVTHGQFKTPHRAILVTGAIALALTIQSSFLAAAAFATITRLLVFASTCLALPVFRRRREGVSEAEFRAPGGLLAAGFALAVIGWLLSQVDLLEGGFPIAVTAAIGLALHGWHRATGNHAPPIAGQAGPAASLKTEAPNEP